MILITGANGLLGSHIVRKLIAEKVEFKALKRSASNLSLLMDEKIDWVEGDILDVTSFHKHLESVDTVIHCAAIVSFYSAENEAMHAVNVEGTRNVVNACIDSEVKNLIHISSIAAFGRSKTTAIINEETTWVDSPLNTTYAETKYLAELEAWRGANEGLNVAVVNPSVVLAAGAEGQSSSKLLDYVWRQSKFYVPGRLNYVDVRDVADAVFTIYQKRIYGERFILNAGSVGYKPLFDNISSRFLRKAPTIEANGLMLRIALVLEIIKYWLTGKKPSVTKEMIKTTRREFTYENSKSISSLNMKYRGLEESLDWVCNEYIRSRG